MGHFFSKVSLFIDKKEAAAHLILDQDFATAPFSFMILYALLKQSFFASSFETPYQKNTLTKE